MCHRFFRYGLLSILIGGTLSVDCSVQQGSSNSKNGQPSGVQVVLTTDIGCEIDDQWAMVHLLLSPEISLRAIVTTHASSIGLSSDKSAQEAAEVLARVSPRSVSRHPPLEAGSSLPLLDATTPRESPGLDLLIQSSQGFSTSQRLVVFVIGAATDVASAILKDPSIVDRISVVAVAFSDWPAGGDIFNVVNDPLAWQVILDSDVPLVIGSVALMRQSLSLTRSEADALMSRHGILGEYLYALFAHWLDTQAPVVAQVVAPETWVIWDEVVVAYVLGMARGQEVPRPRLLSDLSFAHEETPRRIMWLTEIDTDLVWSDLSKKIDHWGLTK